MNKKVLIGYILIIATVLCFGVYFVWSIEKIDSLTEENQNYKNTKDCVFHNQIIDTLKKENEALQSENQAVKSTKEDVISDAEYFLEQYYSRQNTPSAEVIKKIEPLVNETVFKKYKKALGNAGGYDYEMGIEDMHSFCDKKSSKSAEVYCVFKCFLKIPGSKNSVDTTICFNANMEYDKETSKWIVSKVLKHNTVKYIEGF